MTNQTSDQSTAGENGPTPSFEQAQQQLEQIVHQLEDGDIGLAEAMARYERGVGLLRQCYTLLERAERRIEQLAGIDADGNPITEPFDDESTASLDDQGEPRNRRRVVKRKAVRKMAKKAAPRQTDVDEPGSLF